MDFFALKAVSSTAVLATRNYAMMNNWNHRRLTSTILVGYHEKHEVTYDLNHWESIERIYVDGHLAIEKPMRTHLTRFQNIEMTVGVHETHHVRFEFEMNSWEANFGQKHIRVFVDGYLIDTKTT